VIRAEEALKLFSLGASSRYVRAALLFFHFPQPLARAIENSEAVVVLPVEVEEPGVVLGGLLGSPSRSLRATRQSCGRF
jgi:hypothetical protein